ncbi:MAG: SHOCT domain-containing protein [Planctomycetes bacterium]|nr:SHOCT domain-containing protein [Planctomycetota bacterium]
MGAGMVSVSSFSLRGEHKMKHSVECPGCGKTYSVPTEQLGKKATCKSCGEKFVLQAEPNAEAIPPSLPAAAQPVEITPPPKPEKQKGFFGRLKAKAAEAIESAKEKAATTIRTKAVSGPSGISDNSQVVVSVTDGDFTVSTGIMGRTEAFRISLGEITSLEAMGIDKLRIGFSAADTLVLAKTVGSSVEGMAEKITSWMTAQGVLSSEDAENQKAVIRDTVSLDRDEQKARREAEMAVTYLHGPFNAKPNTTTYLLIDGSELVASSLVGMFGRAESFRILLRSIKKAEIETSERMTLARTALLGIYAFGMKKKDKLLRVEFDDNGADASVIFGKGPGMTIEEVSGRIMAARREFVNANAETEKPTDSEKSSQPGDIADAIQKLAALRDQGILTEDEFTSKKAELLSRM